jgi:hypothetical protein
MKRNPTFAEALYPHLTKQSDEVERREPVHGSLAEALYPRPKPTPTNPRRDLLLKNLREHNARMRANG